MEEEAEKERPPGTSRDLEDMEEKVEVGSMGAGGAECHRLPLILLTPTKTRPFFSIQKLPINRRAAD
eukprot:8608759-Pyramimonas_sp.AAC.1